jgi:hypothetical protein
MRPAQSDCGRHDDGVAVRLRWHRLQRQIVAELRVDEDGGLLVMLDLRCEVVSHAFLIMTVGALPLPSASPVTYNSRVLAALLVHARALLDGH